MSYPFRKILCPVQFDESEQNALDLAAQMAKDIDATIYLLHVVLILPRIGAPDAMEASQGRTGDDARLRLQKLADDRLAGLKSEVITRVAGPGEVARAVLEVATELDTDLILLKTHGRTGLAHFIMGSVAEQIVRRAHCAVLTLTSAAKERHSGLSARLSGGGRA
ncbi:MAG TPA: universal stress protein [Candidatus Binataceae bacterium]|jgi:nucleotide-binding universal stress UspA family protein|nr:universal stress protein [Candidatus Binataceae bacterium]